MRSMRNNSCIVFAAIFLFILACFHNDRHWIWFHNDRLDNQQSLCLVGQITKQRDEVSLQLNKLQETHQQLVCKTKNEQDVSSTGGYCDKAVKTGHNTDVKLVQQLAKLFANQTVISLGDGPGTYRQLLLEAGVPKYDAFDGAPNIYNATGGKVRFLDLTLPQYWLPTYDWAMSLEVVEHISHVHEAEVLDNLARAARIGIVLSWAVPGQKGFHHVNCQAPEYVIDVMKKRNFSRNDNLTDTLKAGAGFPYLKRNIMVFERVAN